MDATPSPLRWLAQGEQHVPRDRGWLAGVAGRTALGRLGDPDDVAEAILAVHGMRWVTGQHIVCDGGLSLHSPSDPLGSHPG